MALNWNQVVRAVEDRLKQGIPSATVQIIGGIDEYLAGAVSSALANKDFLILLSRPTGDHRSAAPMFSGLHLKRYDILIALVVKTDPTTVARTLGKDKKGISDIEDEIYVLLEHNNLNNLCDNKAGSNFEGGWTQLPTENKAISVSQTLYCAEKTER